MSRPKSLEGNKEYIKTQGVQWLENKFRLPVEITDTAAFIVAQRYTFGEDETLWLNGKQLHDIKLRLDIVIPETST